jgi:hypothetical protein
MLAISQPDAAIVSFQNSAQSAEKFCKLKNVLHRGWPRKFKNHQ